MKKAFFVLLVIILSYSLFSLTACSTSNPAASPTAVPTCGIVGFSTSGGNGNIPAGYFCAIPVTVTANTVVSTLSVLADGTSGYVAMAIYDGGTGPSAPAGLLAQTNIVLDSGSWSKGSITPLTLVPGHYYWLVSIGRNAGNRFLDGDPAHTILFTNYSWSSFLSSGFPLDASGLSWVTYSNAGNIISASTCE